VAPSHRLLLVRHGQSVWNAEGRWQGHADPPLSPLGEEQAAAAAARLDGVTAVYTSDLLRARRTAEIFAFRFGLEAVVDARLRERRAGDWEGHTRIEIEAKWPGYLASGRRPRGYETDDSVLARALEALTAIAGEQHGDAVVLTHGGVVRTLERHLAEHDAPDVDLILPNLGGRWLLAEGGTLRLGERVVLVEPAEQGERTRPGAIHED
jgi:broad specificity phosphatase PhoE